MPAVRKRTQNHPGRVIIRKPGEKSGLGRNINSTVFSACGAERQVSGAAGGVVGSILRFKTQRRELEKNIDYFYPQ